MWETACGVDTCEGCGETVQAGEDIYVSDRRVYCECCGEEVELDEDLDTGIFGDYDESDDYFIDGVGFADPGGNSALRAATSSNPRNLPCPTCGEENRLTPLGVKACYQCDLCADALEENC